MDNPFLKRATEFFRDEEAFLAVLSPEPIQFFLTREGRETILYEKLVLIRGTPGVVRLLLRGFSSIRRSPLFSETARRLPTKHSTTPWRNAVL